MQGIINLTFFSIVFYKKLNKILVNELYLMYLRKALVKYIRN